MKRKPSASSYDKKPGSYKSFREDDRKSGDKGDKPFRKSNSADGPERPKRAPYGDAGKKPPFEKRDSRRDASSSEGRPYDKERGAKRSFDKPDRFKRPSDEGDRPKRSFDRDDKKPYSSRGKEDSDRPKRFFDRDDKKPYSSRGKEDNARPKRSFDRDDKKPYSGRGKEDSERPKRSFDKDDKKPYSGRSKEEGERPKRSFDKPDRFKRSSDEGEKPKRSFEKRGEGDKTARAVSFENGHARPFERKVPGVKKTESGEKPKTAFNTPHRFKRQAGKHENQDGYADKDEPKLGKSLRRRKPVDEDEEDMNEESGLMTLNKFIAHSGECSRRDAGELVKQGKVKVNGELVTDPGYRVQETDKVTLVGKKLTPQKNRAYILLNKPKGFITTTEDPQERKTVMDLVANSGVDRLYPVGRLDRNTTGLLLLTNDGDLAQKLSHPSHEVKKIYQVTLNKPITKADFDKIIDGLTLEDGKVRVDELSYLESKSELGIQIHSGRNRIVRRIFESLGYEVEKLDRVIYAGLTKKNLPRSKWRFLTEQEIILLKHFKS